MKKTLITVALLSFFAAAFAQVPTITSFSPSNGPAGTTVTITGTNFSTTAADNVVYFGGVKAVVNTASATTLTVVSPPGVPPDVISVTTGGKTAYSAKPYYNTFNGQALKNSSFIGVGDLPVSIGIGPRPPSIESADFDGDGKVDFIIQASQSIGVFRNTSTGPGIISYAAKIDLVTDVTPGRAKAADIDGDGKLDIALVYLSSSKVSLFKNTSTPGSISFDPKVDMTMLGNGINVCANDLDGDGRPDIVVSSNQGVSIYRNTSAVGTFGFDLRQDIVVGDVTGEALVLDLDGDSKPDMAAGKRLNGSNLNNIALYRNTSTVGTISFASPVFSASAGNGNTVYLFAGDLNMDGRMDLGTGTDNRIDLMKNLSSVGSMSFPGSVAYFTQYFNNFTVNVNGDATPEFIQPIASFIPGQGISSYVRPVFPPQPADPWVAFTDQGELAITGLIIVGVADLDLDSKPDLIMKRPDGSLTILRNRVNEPVVDSFTPQVSTPGTTVTITGENFTGATAVTFGGTAATSFNVVSPNSITAVVGAGASGDVVVQSPGGTGKKSGFIHTTALPTITTFAPATGHINETITITGTLFTGATGVTFGGTAATSFTVVSDTEIKAVAANGSSGDVVVVTPLANATKSGFTFVIEPTITSFTPTSGAAGTVVTISGTGFHQMVSVKFGGGPTPYSVVDYNTITATLVAASGSGDVEVKTDFGTGTKSGFTFHGVPSITSFAPTSAAKGAKVTITGTGFSGATSVTLGNTAATFTIVNPTSIEATVGDGSTGDVKVVGPGGTSSKEGFTFIPSPSITSFAPTSAEKDADVTITGTNFTGATSVTFGGTAAKSFAVSSATSIVAKVGNGSSGNVVVTTANGTATAAGFIYVETAPLITTFTPTVGSPGTEIAIVGSNFTGASAVSFGGTAAQSFTVVSATTIIAKVAEGATGNVSVTTPRGTASLAGFGYVPPLGIEDPINVRGISLSPMPSDGRFVNISFDSRWEGKTASLRLNDVTGKQIASDEIVCRPVVTWGFNSNALASGMYLITIKTDGVAIVRKMIVR